MLTYKVIAMPERHEFEDAVNHYIRDGWQLQGNLIVHVGLSGIIWIQAIVFDDTLKDTTQVLNTPC